jgi:hypothetical protein
MAHVIHVADADWNKRPRNAVGVGAARSSAVVCCGCISRPEVVPNEGHSIPLLSAHLVWVSSCTPHAADTHHRHNSHPQQMSSHSLSARQSHGAAGAKAEPTRLSVRTRYSPHSHARLGDPAHTVVTVSSDSHAAFHQSETISITSCCMCLQFGPPHAKMAWATALVVVVATSITAGQLLTVFRAGSYWAGRTLALAQ